MKKKLILVVCTALCMGALGACGNSATAKDGDISGYSSEENRKKENKKEEKKKEEKEKDETEKTGNGVWVKVGYRTTSNNESYDTLFEYDDRGNLIEEAEYSTGNDTKRRWTTYEYDDQDRVKNMKQTMVYDGYKDETSYEYTYEGNTVHSFVSWNEGLDSYQGTDVYDMEGKLMSHEEIWMHNGDWYLDEYIYNDKGDLNYVLYYDDTPLPAEFGDDKWWTGTEYYYDYDENGRISTKYETACSYYGGNEVPDYTTNLEYDEEGRLIKETKYDAGNCLTNVKEYRYDEYGNLLECYEKKLGGQEVHTEYMYEYVEQ